MTPLARKLSEMRVLEQAMARSLRDGRRWLQSRAVPGGRVLRQRNTNSFGKPVWGLWSAGAPRAAVKAMLDRVAAAAVQPNGDLGFDEEVEAAPGGLPVYRSLYCLMAAAGIRHPLARDPRVRRRLAQYQSGRTGAVFRFIGHDPARPRPAPLHATLMTSTALHVFLALGMPERARRAGDYLVRLVRQNRAHLRKEGLFYFQADLAGRIITDIPPRSRISHVLSRDEAKQQFFQTGAVMAALAKLARWILDRPRPDRRAARPYLEAAFELLRFEQTMRLDGYEWPQKCKVAWGGGDLLRTCLRHGLAGEEQLLALYQATRRTVALTFIDSQLPDGSWAGDSVPLVDHAPEFDYDYKLMRGLANAPRRPTGSKTCAWAPPLEITGEFLGEMAVARAGVADLIAWLTKRTRRN